MSGRQHYPQICRIVRHSQLGPFHDSFGEQPYGVICPPVPECQATCCCQSSVFQRTALIFFRDGSQFRCRGMGIVELARCQGDDHLSIEQRRPLQAARGWPFLRWDIKRMLERRFDH